MLTHLIRITGTATLPPQSIVIPCWELCCNSELVLCPLKTPGPVVFLDRYATTRKRRAIFRDNTAFRKNDGCVRHRRAGKPACPIFLSQTAYAGHDSGFLAHGSKADGSITGRLGRSKPGVQSPFESILPHNSSASLLRSLNSSSDIRSLGPS